MELSMTLQASCNIRMEVEEIRIRRDQAWVTPHQEGLLLRITMTLVSAPSKVPITTPTLSTPSNHCPLSAEVSVS